MTVGRGAAAGAGVLAVLAIALAVYWMLPERTGGTHSQIAKIRYMLNDLKGTFEGGQALRVPPPSSRPGGRDQDMRVGIVGLQLEQLQSTLGRNLRDAARREAVFAKLTEARDFWNGFVEGPFRKAVESKKAEDAVALVAEVNVLEQHLDELEKHL